MSAVPSAESVCVAGRGCTSHSSMPPVSRPRRPHYTTRGPAAAALAAIGRIHALMREHGITLSELGAAYALSRIHALMVLHGITIEDLRGEVPAVVQQQKCEVPVTRCPSLDHDPRYQLPPGARVVGPFTAEWLRLRGVSNEDEA